MLNRLKTCGDYQKSHLLRILADSKLNEKYSKQWGTFKVCFVFLLLSFTFSLCVYGTLLQVLMKTNISLDLSINPAEAIALLIEKGLYSEARTYALENNIPPHHITIAEATALVVLSFVVR